jgi:hypothetical protein
MFAFNSDKRFTTGLGMDSRNRPSPKEGSEYVAEGWVGMRRK